MTSRRDIVLSDEERFDVLEQMARIYRTEADAWTVLAQIRFPRNHLPVWQNINAVQWWTLVFFEFDNGILPAPYRSLLYASLRVYASNTVLRRIAIRHGVIEPRPGEADPGHHDDARSRSTESEATSDPPPPPQDEAAPTCHVIVQASSDDERSEVAAVLRGAGLDPHEVWSTSHAVSYRVNRQDPSEVRRLLDDTDLAWTVVPPGLPDYLVHTLDVQGPDGRQWRFTDAPAHQAVADIGSEVIDQYPQNFSDQGRPIVVDKVAPDGTGQRLHGPDTLHDAGVRDGDQLRVGVEPTAGGSLAHSDRVFLCHARQDKEKVRSWYDRLRHDGVQAWLDAEDLHAGANWDYEIRRVIEECAAVVVFLSTTSVTKRGYVQREIGYALDVAQNQPQGVIYIVPVRLEPCEIPHRLSRWHCVDLFHPNGYFKLLKSLRIVT